VNFYRDYIEKRNKGHPFWLLGHISTKQILELPKMDAVDKVKRLKKKQKKMEGE